MEHPPDRRDFLRAAAAAGPAWALGASAESKEPAQAVKAAPARPAGDVLRVGLVGLGERGTYLLRILLGIEGAQLCALCDLVEAKVARAKRLVEEHRQAVPAGYSGGPADYQRLCARTDVDLVLLATPSPLHAPMALAALGSGKHVATETPAAGSVEQCWQLVDAAEKAARHCVLLENYCYQRDVMLIWNLVRLGLFGEIVHAEGGYQRDDRETELALNADGSLGWRGQARRDRVGNTLPTHDIGPLAQWMDIQRGDRFDYLVSMGGNACGFREYAAQYFGREHPLAAGRFDMADINASLIRTVKGRTIYLLSDTLLSRPQPRNLYRLMGSKGIYDRTLDKLYLESKSPRRDRWHGEWEPWEYYQEFDHPAWRDLRNRTIGSGYGGADYLCVSRAVQALRTGAPPDIDVYDAAAWSCIVGLSEQSARSRSQAVDFPDFTRGKWRTRQPAAFVADDG